MRSLRYLNAVLTIIAVLLSLHLWTLWDMGPVGVDSADPVVDLASPAYAVGLTNAAAQRQQMIQQLKGVNKNVKDLNLMFRSGKARVRTDDKSSDKPANKK